MEHNHLKVVYPSSTAADSPLVVVMGWLGANHKYLAKYSALMLEQGCICVQVLQPATTVFSPVEGPPRRFAAGVVHYLLDNQLVKDREVIFYIFSNGGAILYQYIALAFQEDRFPELKAQLRGVIFDSCPAYLYHSKGIAALTYGWSKIARLLVAVMFYLISWTTRPFVGSIPERFWRRMQEFNLGVPELYIFSKNDELTTYADLEKLVKYRQGRGVAAESLIFDDSPHVSHLRAHPKQYTATIANFVRQVLAK